MKSSDFWQFNILWLLAISIHFMANVLIFQSFIMRDSIPRNFVWLVCKLNVNAIYSTIGDDWILHQNLRTEIIRAKQQNKLYFIIFDQSEIRKDRLNISFVKSCQEYSEWKKIYFFSAKSAKLLCKKVLFYNKVFIYLRKSNYFKFKWFLLLCNYNESINYPQNYFFL
jgi:hypothetical protein